MSRPNMTDTLGEIFGTTKTAAVAQATNEDLEKQAQIDFFTNLCVEKGIDVSKLAEPVINELFKTAMEMKAAGEKDPKEEEAEKAKKKEEKEKEAAAASKLASADAEFQEKRAAAVKVAEADMMGRIMAHSFTNELKKIAGEMPPAFAAHAAGKKEEGEGKTEKKEEKEEKDEKEKKEASARAAALITAFENTKTAGAPAATPSLDELAGNHAIDLLKEAGINSDLAVARINAVYTLGLEASTKIASATSTEAAINVRALEYCEAAGFPVNWEA